MRFNICIDARRARLDIALMNYARRSAKQGRAVLCYVLLTEPCEAAGIAEAARLCSSIAVTSRPSFILAYAP